MGHRLRARMAPRFRKHGRCDRANGPPERRLQDEGYTDLNLVILELFAQGTLIELPDAGLGNRFNEYDVVGQPPLHYSGREVIHDLVLSDRIAELLLRHHARK